MGKQNCFYTSTYLMKHQTKYACLLLNSTFRYIMVTLTNRIINTENMIITIIGQTCIATSWHNWYDFFSNICTACYVVMWKPEMGQWRSNTAHNLKDQLDVFFCSVCVQIQLQVETHHGSTTYCESPITPNIWLFDVHKLLTFAPPTCTRPNTRKSIM